MSSRITKLLLALPVLTFGCVDAPPGATPQAIDGGNGSEDGNPRLASAQIAGEAVDFGRALCGGAAAAEKALEVRNVGNEPLHWSATLKGDAPFAIVSASSGVVPAGQTTTLTLAMKPVSATALAGQKLEATLTITTDDKARTHAIALRGTAAGGALALTPARVAFGDVALEGDAKATPVSLTNSGNEAVRVALGATDDPQFSLAWEGGPGSVELAPGTALRGLVARFKPSGMANASATADIRAEGTVCGNSATAISLEGRGTQSVVAVSPADVDFGQVNCGATSAARSVTVSNPGNVAYTFTAALRGAATAPFTVAPETGTVAPGASVTLTVTPKAVPQASATTPDGLADALVITTDAPGDTSHTVALHETARGARLTWQPGSFDFGGVPLTARTTSPGTLVNAGNAPATVTLAATSAEFSVTPAGARTLAGGTELSFDAAFAPTATGARTGAIAASIAAGDVLCAPLPASATLTGTGTSGSLALSATSLDFGRTACGARATAQSLVVSNAGTAPFTFTADLAKGASSPFALAPTSGSVPAGGSVTLALTPSTLPATAATTVDLFGDTLTLRTSIPGEAARAVALRQTAFGAVLAWSPAQIAFGDVPAGGAPTLPFALTNSGNASVIATLAASAPPFSVSPGVASTVAAGGSLSGIARFAPTSATAALSSQVTVAVRPGEPLCAPAPAPASLTGRGTTGVVTLSAAGLDFGAVNCGAAGAPRSVSLGNTGNATYTFDARLLRGAGSPYTVSPATGTVGPGQTVQITMTPAAVGTSYSALPDLAETLRITTRGAFGDSPHDVALRQTAQGVLLTATPATVDVGAVRVGQEIQGTLTLRNAGNVATVIELALIEPNGSKQFQLTPAPVTVPASGSAPVNVLFTPTYGGTHANRARLANRGEPLCAPLPAPVNLQGTARIGQATLSGTSIALPNLVCGATPTATGQVTLTNTGDAPFTYTLAENGGRFRITSAITGTLAPSQSAAIVVAQVAVSGANPADVITDTVMVTTSIPSSQPQTVSVSETVQGTTLLFPATCFVDPRTGARRCVVQSQTWSNQTGQRAFNVSYRSNENAPVTVFAGPTNTGATPFTVPTGATFIANGVGAATGQVDFSPRTDGRTHTGDFRFRTSAHLCDTPNTLPLSGQIFIVN